MTFDRRIDSILPWLLNFVGALLRWGLRTPSWVWSVFFPIFDAMAKHERKTGAAADRRAPDWLTIATADITTLRAR
ncbi:hypothetical protein [Bradyrhizobium sp.]|jgi:hypothetical protein|uniref:hypothetical protein n=1 Tax=Bradyrhizobium sp. TaxID=376 RepID=UPI003C1352C8